MENAYKSMSHQTVLTMWETLRGRFMKMVEGLTEEQLDLNLHETSIRSLLTHTAEAEMMFAEWYLGKEQPAELPQATTLAEITELLQLSDAHIVEAINALTEEQLYTAVQSKMGASTPVEAVSRLLYHAGIHAGQITLMKK